MELAAALTGQDSLAGHAGAIRAPNHPTIEGKDPGGIIIILLSSYHTHHISLFPQTHSVEMVSHPAQFGPGMLL